MTFEIVEFLTTSGLIVVAICMVHRWVKKFLDKIPSPTKPYNPNR